MLKKSFIYFFMLIILSSLCLAWSDYSNITGYYKLDISGKFFDSTGNNSNGSVTGTTLNTSVAKINNSFQFNGQADQVITTFATSKSTGHSFCSWIYAQANPPANGAIIYIGQPGVYEFVTLGAYTTGCNATTICYGTYDTAYSVARTNTSFNLNTWIFFCAVKTASQSKLYYNGVLDNFTTSGALSGSDADIYMGGQSGTTRNFTGLLDEVSFWNRSLSDSEVLDLYNLGTGLSWPFTASNVSAYIIPPTPADNSHNNTNVTIKINCSAGIGITNYTYYLWFDNTTGTTPVLISSTTDNWTTNTSIDGHYYYKAGCKYGTTTSSNTTLYNWYYDTTNPIIAIGANNEFNSNNYTSNGINQYDNVLNISLGFSDNIALYAYELNFTNSAGAVMYNKTNTTLTGTTYNYNENKDVSSWPPGTYYAEISLSDTHTALAIEEYEVTALKEIDKASLSYDTIEGNNIKITGLASTEASTIKYSDKYDFTFSYDNKIASDKVFIVESQDGGKVRYIPDSRYKAHFVIFNENSFNGNWVDFEGIEGTPSVVCESDYKCLVTFKALESEEITFKSIGGLNIVKQYYRFYRGNYTQFDEDVFTGEPITIGLNITNDTSLSLINISLNHNGTLYNVSNVSGTGWIYFYQNIITPPTNSTAVLYNWSLADLQGDGSVTFLYFTGNYTTYYWNLSINCSAPFNITTIRMIIYDELVPANYLNASVEVNISLWLTNTSLAKNLNYNFTGNYSYDICLNANTTFKINLYLKDSVIDGFTHRYYLFNQSISDDTLYISLYNFNTTTATDLLRITARDSETYQPYSEVLGILQRYYVGEGLWRIVQMDLSDDYGLLIYDITEKSADYRLLFYDIYNNLLKTSDTLRFSCDAGVCEIVSLISPEGESTTTADLQVNNTFNNNTKMLYVYWSDSQSLVSSVRILLTKETITGETILFNVTQNGSAGTYSFNLSGVTGMVLVSVYKTASPESSAVSFWINLVENAFNKIIGNDEGALYSFIIMVVVIMIGIISPVACIIAGIVGLIGIYALGIFGAVTLSVIGVAVVMGIVLGIKIKR